MIEMFWAKVFGTRTEIVVAICDEELLGKVIEFKSKKIEIKVSKNFYGERLIDEKIVLRLLEKATNGNLLGKNIVKIAEKNGYISKENIINIDGIPHAQFTSI